MRFHALGGPEVLRLEEVPVPSPRPGEVLIRVQAIGVNFADTRFVRGEYFVRPVFPQIPGMEASGVVTAVGEGVTEFAVGARVMTFGANAYAEQQTARVDMVYPMPDGLGFAEAAALPVQGLTAHHLLHLSGRMRAGERVLVHAAAGGVGLLAVQLARGFGASQVIGVVSSAAKVGEVLAAGAHAVIDSSVEDWAARTKDLTEKAGVDIILEMVGGSETFKRNLSVLAPFGRMIVFGAASGDTKGTIEPVGLMARNHAVIGYYLTPLLRQRALCAGPLAEMCADAVAGKLKVHIGGRAPLSDAVSVLTAIEGRRTIGKLILEP